MRSQSSRGPSRSLARAAAGAALALGAMAFACGGDESSKPAAAPSPEPAAEQPAAPAPATPEPAAQAIAPAPDAGGTATEGVLPEGYPNDVPVYPGADTGSAMSIPGSGVFVLFESDDSVEAILTHYRSELANNGWTIQDTPDGGGIDGTKGGRSVQVRARTAESGRSEIAVSAEQG